MSIGATRDRRVSSAFFFCLSNCNDINPNKKETGNIFISSIYYHVFKKFNKSILRDKITSIMNFYFDMQPKEKGIKGHISQYLIR